MIMIEGVVFLTVSHSLNQLFLKETKDYRENL